MSNEQCPPHHWKIDEFNVGRCIKCPAVMDFGALQKKESIPATVMLHLAQRGGKRGRKGNNRGIRKS